MNGSVRLAATGSWLLLVAATLIGCWLADILTDGRWATLIVIVIATFKIRLVIRHFMEVPWAALPWRLALEGWVLLVTILILGGYLFSFP